MMGFRFAVVGFLVSVVAWPSADAKSSVPLDEAGLIQELKDIASHNHHSANYHSARIELLGTISLSKNGPQYVVKDVYCEKSYPSPGPGKIPSNSVINVEHTWPQSKFGGSSKESQKSDLHHLYPTDSELNSIRGNHPFGVVENPMMVTKCPISQIGDNAQGELVFEPPAAQKGNVARAIFYFSVRYGLKVDKSQEDILKQWNKDDPPDEFEIKRNDEIEKFQGNRNPFIDDSELVDLVNDF
jgi:deoxyribonuclease I